MSTTEIAYEPGIIDPGTPLANSTKAFWQSQPSNIANHRSPWIEQADVVIIGSGISGTSIARTLFENQPDLSVVLVDARSLCSGATGRNGGHIKTNTYSMWVERKEKYGLDEAIRLTAFEASHLPEFASVLKETQIDCDFVRTEGIDAYFDRKAFQKAMTGLEDMRRHVPHLAARYTVYTDLGKLQELKLSARCVGAIGVPAASIWPYKLVTGLQEKMLRENKLNVQTNTTVLGVTDDPNAEFAVVSTTRGTIWARHVVHATNGWLGHLLPELRPYISPVRGNVIRQISTAKDVPGLDPRVSYWAFYGSKDYDYMIQRADGGFVIGRANLRRRATGDDRETDVTPMAHLRGIASEIFDGGRSDAQNVAPTVQADVTHAWSGVLGFTGDGSTLIGRLPFSGRSHQWVCGGYQGMGMIKAFLSGRATALMILGKEVPDEFPRSGLLTQQRLRRLDHSVGSASSGAKL